MATMNKFESDIALQNVSLQFADVVIVSVDTRGFNIARRLALLGWKTVVIELSGSAFTERDWADRLGPFLAWEAEGTEAIDSHGEPLRTEYPGLWLQSGPVAFGGRTAKAGAGHLQIRYGIPNSVQAAGKKSSKAQTLEQGWPDALSRNLVSARLARRESYLPNALSRFKDTPRLPLEEPVKTKVSAEAVARSRREGATAAGVRILEAEQVTAVRMSDGRVDRIEFRTTEGVFTERTRSLVWMLSEEESSRVEFIGPEVSLARIFTPGKCEPLMAWWRSRLAVRGLKRSQTRALTRVPMTPPHVVVIGSIERPWTHDNLLILDVVEETNEMRVYDVWTRLPYWARADHVYRDELRLLAQGLLADRFVGCELIWVTPSPLALTDPAVRLPHILYSEDSIPPRGRLENICFAGPESWPAIGFRGLKPIESKWIGMLEELRIQWDPVARMQASRGQKLKFAFKNFVRSRRLDARANTDNSTGNSTDASTDASKDAQL
jgi:hypothetical protein